LQIHMTMDACNFTRITASVVWHNEKVFFLIFILRVTTVLQERDNRRYVFRS